MGEVGTGFPLQRIIRIALVAVAVLVASTRPSIAFSQTRIIAVGDLHGDYDAWIAIARASGLIDSNGHWAAGKTTLVQLGDVLDREPDSLKIVRSLQQLQTEAPRSGGHVVVVLGNHEAMNLLGDFRYTTPGEFAAFSDPRSPERRDRYYASIERTVEAAAHAQNPGSLPAQIRQQWMADHPLGWIEHARAWSPSGALGRWATNNPAVTRIDGTLFVHGGLSAEYSKFSLQEINRRVRNAMAAGDDGQATILYDPLGPLWYRGLVIPDADAEAERARAVPKMVHLSVDQETDVILKAFGAQRLVIAHTPDLKGIEFLSGGRVARIDTGISRAYGGPLTWLEISDGKMIPHRIERSAK